MAVFLPHIAPVPYGNISLTTHWSFTDYCCPAYLAQDRLPGDNCTVSSWWRTGWWDKQGRKPFHLIVPLHFFLSHTASYSWFPFPGIPCRMEMLTLTHFYCL